MLRYFYEELPWVYVIAAGSRLHSLMKPAVARLSRHRDICPCIAADTTFSQADNGRHRSDKFHGRHTIGVSPEQEPARHLSPVLLRRTARQGYCEVWLTQKIPSCIIYAIFMDIIQEGY